MQFVSLMINLNSKRTLLIQLVKIRSHGNHGHLPLPSLQDVFVVGP